MTDNKVVEWGSGTGDTFRKQKSHIEARKQIVSFDFPWCVLFDGENWCGPARVRQLRRERPYLRPRNRLSRWLTFKSVFVSFYVFKRNIFPVDWDGKDRRRKKGETRKIQFIIESQHGERRKKLKNRITKPIRNQHKFPFRVFAPFMCLIKGSCVSYGPGIFGLSD